MVARSNTTYYFSKRAGGTLRNPNRSNCMMGVRNLDGEFNIVVPFELLQENLKKEDVYKWVEIGNKLIFPAKISEGYSEYTKLQAPTDPMEMALIEELEDVIIERKMDKLVYSQYDATSVNTAKIINVSIQNGFTTGVLDILTSSRGHEGGSWHIRTNDFRIQSTGECLEAYCERRSKEIILPVKEKKSSTKDNSFVITLDLDKCISNNHKLAVLTFYRYLYSDYYRTIVRYTLDLVDSKIDPWQALMTVHAAYLPRYTGYYGLTYPELRNMPSMEDVVANLRKNNSVNASFFGGPTKSTTASFKMTNKLDFGYLAEQLFSNTTKLDEVVCINKGNSKYLTTKSVYKLHAISSNSNQFKVLNDDYCLRWYKKDRFKLAESN